MATTHEPLHLDKWRFVQWKSLDVTATYIWTITFFGVPFAYAMVRNFEVMLGKALNHFV
jgi:hypothetical protein